MRQTWRRSLAVACIGASVITLLVSCRHATESIPQSAGAPASQGTPPSGGPGPVPQSAAPPAPQGAPPPGGPAMGVSPPGGASLRFALASTGLPTSGVWKVVPTLADINGDGIPDLAALPGAGRGAQVWLGSKGGTWVGASSGLRRDGSCGGAVQFADVNRDGHLDLVVADHCSGVSVYLGDGQGQWQVGVQDLRPGLSQRGATSGAGEESVLAGADGVAIGDVNEDGFLDLVACASNEGGFTVYLGDGSGRVWKEVTEPDGLPSAVDPEPGDREQGGFAPQVLLTDVDGDGHLDVVAAFYKGPRVWRGDGKGRWQPASTGLPNLEAGGVYFRIAVGDVNEDGRVDLVAAHLLTGPEIYLQEVDGAWRRSPSPALASLKGADAVALGDLDGDGHLDLVVAGPRGTRGLDHGLFVFRGNGKADWTEVAETGLPARGYRPVWGITLGDVNGDGALDLVVATGDYPTLSSDRSSAGTSPRPARPTGPQPQIQVWIRVKE